MSDRFRATQRIPAGENAYDRLQPNAYAGAGDVADQVTPFQPDIDLEARPQGDAGQDRGGRSFRADGYKLPKPLVHRRHRSAKATAGVFDSLAKLLLNPVVKCVVKPFMKDVYKYVPVFNRLKEEHKAGKDPILRKATALLLIHTPKSNRFGSEDANLAYQNASLMAQSLGVSQIYMGFVLTAIWHSE